MVFSQALTSYFQRKRSSTAKMRRGRRKRRRRGDNLVAPDIPLDVLIEILTRLPAKSLMRFKCVSNLWSSLIRSRYFSNRYLTVASPPRPPHLYMSLEDCRNRKPYESVLLSLSSSSSSSSSSSYDQYLTMPGIRGSYMVVVLRSLILYTVCGQACIYNPTTRQSVTLPAIKPLTSFPKNEYVFGHDPVLDQYKVVCNVCIHSKTTYKLIASENWVFVVEAGGSWKRIEFDQHHRRTNPGVCINGVIYYLAFTLKSRNVVVSFDVRSEEFNMIQIPLVETAYFESTGLIEYGGKPAIIKHTIRKGLVDLWVLENAGNWSRKSLVVKPCQMQSLDSNVSFHLKGTTQNGEVILAPYSLIIPRCRCPYILFYDLQKNDLRKVMIRLPNHGLLKGYRNVLGNIKPADMSESIMHLET